VLATVGAVTEPILHLSLPVDDLAAAREFYEQGLGCRVGRVREQWFDVWFFGLQLTLALRPDEVTAVEDQGARHFGVVLADRDEFAALVERIGDHGISWISEPTVHAAPELTGKVGGKLADPAGNVIEIKYYDDPDAFRADETN
jgi:extradiol dioxygenase family protein